MNEKKLECDKETEKPRNDAANAGRYAPQEDGVLERTNEMWHLPWESIGPCGFGC